jgi:ubiquinone/menaquinone biosynthesis C-methylase UbiE
MSNAGHWQLDGSAPELYERYLVPAITSLWAADLIERAKPQAQDRVLDIACGTGAVTRMAADKVAKGNIVGLDFNAGMLATARKLRPDIEWHEGSALALPFADKSFDVVLCQLGLQFFPDQPLALREMRRVLVGRGRAALSVYSPIEQTPAAYAFIRALDKQLGAEASRVKRSEHSFLHPDQLGDLMTAEGFAEVVVSTVTKIIQFPSVLDYVRFQLTATPMAALLSEKSTAERERIIGAVTRSADALLPPELKKNGQLSSPQESYVAVARAP